MQYTQVRQQKPVLKHFALQISKPCTEYFLQDIERIFSNILDIYEFSVTFLGLLEAAIEVADEGKQPAIGECFEEMAEVQ